jgi:DNA invertase Pin-like site-specific DNA recombinase
MPNKPNRSALKHGLSLMFIGFGRKQESSDDSSALESAGCERSFFYEATFELEERLEQVFDFARAGDVVVVLDLDRLGATLRDVLESIAQFSDNAVGLKVEKYGIIPGTALGDSFGAACKVLRDVDAPSQGAQLAHRRRGRPNVLDMETQAKALKLLSGNASVLEVARVLRVSPATIYRYFPKRSGRAVAKTDKA